MRGFVVAGLALVLTLGFSGGADARRGRGGFGFARTSPAVGAHAKPAPKPHGVGFVSTGAMGSGAAAGPAGAGATAGSAGPMQREAQRATAVAQPRIEAEAPQRPWCDTGKVLGGLCVLN